MTSVQKANHRPCVHGTSHAWMMPCRVTLQLDQPCASIHLSFFSTSDNNVSQPGSGKVCKMTWCTETMECGSSILDLDFTWVILSFLWHVMTRWEVTSVSQNVQQRERFVRSVVCPKFHVLSPEITMIIENCWMRICRWVVGVSFHWGNPKDSFASVHSMLDSIQEVTPLG